MDENAKKKRVRDDSYDSEFDSLDVKRIKDELLNGLDDSDINPATHDLDSVIMSFQQEIRASASSPAPDVIDLTEDSGEFQPDFGYLLEASDDDLGLPPSSIRSSSEEAKDKVSRANELDRVGSDATAGIGEFWGFEDEIPSYDSLEFQVFDSCNNTETVVFDDVLFDHSNFCF